MGGKEIYGPTGIENVGPSAEHPLQGGTFYLDATSTVLSYAPSSHPLVHRNPVQSSATAEAVVGTPETPTPPLSVVLPVATQLVVGAGTRDAPIVGVSFQGVRFSMTTWGRPSSADGYVEVQSGKVHVVH